MLPGQLGIEYLSDGYSRIKVGIKTDSGLPTAWSGLKYISPDIRIYGDNGITGGADFVAKLPTIQSTNIHPEVDKNGSIGSLTYRWSDGHINTIYSDILNPLGTTKTIGSDLDRWKYAFIDNITGTNLQVSAAIVSSIKTHTSLPLGDVVSYVDEGDSGQSYWVTKKTIHKIGQTIVFSCVVYDRSNLSTYVNLPVAIYDPIVMLTPQSSTFTGGRLTSVNSSKVEFTFTGGSTGPAADTGMHILVIGKTDASV